MLTIKAINQDLRKRNDLTVYIFIDCATSLKHFKNYYFSKNPKNTFVAHYMVEGKHPKRKETHQCYYCDVFFRYNSKFNKHVKYCSSRPGFICTFQNDRIES